MLPPTEADRFIYAVPENIADILAIEKGIAVIHIGAFRGAHGGYTLR